MKPEILPLLLFFNKPLCHRERAVTARFNATKQTAGLRSTVNVGLKATSQPQTIARRIHRTHL